jgi:hypothetical protein
MRMLACCKEILKEKKGSFSGHISVPAFCRLSSGTCASPPALLNISHDAPDDLPAVQKEVSPA